MKQANDRQTSPGTREQTNALTDFCHIFDKFTMKQAVLQEFAPSERRRKRCDVLLFLAGIYFFCSRRFCPLWSNDFYTKRVLENIERISLLSQGRLANESSARRSVRR